MANGWRHGDLDRRDECECGAAKQPVAASCPECARLDGEDLPHSARVVLSELRQLVRASGDTIAMELTGYCRRTIARGLAALLRAGRVRRHEVPVMAQLGARSRFGTGYTDRTFHVVAEYELVEAVR